MRAMLSHDGKPGLLRTDGAGNTAIDAQLDFTHSNHKSLPANRTFTWSGTLTVPSAGDYWIYLQALGSCGVLKIDGKAIGRTGATKGTVHGDIQYATQDNGFPTVDGLDNVRRSVHLTAGPHEITVEASGDTSNNPEADSFELVDTRSATSRSSGGDRRGKERPCGGDLSLDARETELRPSGRTG